MEEAVSKKHRRM